MTEFQLAWGWSNNIWERDCPEEAAALVSSDLPALLSLSDPKRSDEKWSQAQLLLIRGNIWALWSGMLKGREEISVVLLAALIAAGRVEIVTAFTRRHSQGSTVNYSRRIQFISYFRLLQALLPKQYLKSNSIPLPAACTEKLMIVC